MLRPAALIAAAILFAPPALAGPSDQAASLRLTFETGAQTGALMVALYDQATYAGGAPIRSARIDVAAGDASVTFDGLADADYAVKAFHDVNGNGRMDTNPFGLPIEPFAFSNNAVGNMGPADWDRARLPVSGQTAQTILIR